MYFWFRSKLFTMNFGLVFCFDVKTALLYLPIFPSCTFKLLAQSILAKPILLAQNLHKKINKTVPLSFADLNSFMFTIRKLDQGLWTWFESILQKIWFYLPNIIPI